MTEGMACFTWMTEGMACFQDGPWFAPIELVLLLLYGQGPLIHIPTMETDKPG